MKYETPGVQVGSMQWHLSQGRSLLSLRDEVVVSDQYILILRNPHRDEIEAVLGPYHSQVAAHRDLDWLLKQGMNEDMRAGDENVGAFRLLTKEEFLKQFSEYFQDDV